MKQALGTYLYHIRKLEFWHGKYFYRAINVLQFIFELYCNFIQWSQCTSYYDSYYTFLAYSRKASIYKKHNTLLVNIINPTKSFNMINPTYVKFALHGI